MHHFTRCIRIGILVVALPWLMMFVVLGLFLARNAEDDAKDALALRLIDSIEVLNNAEQDGQFAHRAFREAALAKCRIVALALETPPMQNKTNEEKMQLLNKLIGFCNISNYAVTDQNGIITLSSAPEIIGYDMKSGEQSREFLPAIADREFYCFQTPQPRSVDGKPYQYAGVARLDTPGIVLVSFELKNYESVISVGSIRKRMQTMRIGKRGFIVVIRKHTVIVAEDKTIIGQKIPEIDLSGDIESGSFFKLKFNGEKYMATYEMLGDMQIVGMLPTAEIYGKVNDCIIVLAGALAIGVLGMILVFKGGKRFVPEETP